MESSSLFLGFDGGRSGTRCVVINERGEIIGQGEAGKTDFVLAPGGKNKLKVTLTSALQQALPNHSWRFRSAFLGLSGVIKGGALEAAVRSVCEDIFMADHLEIDTDAFVALAGALKLQPGIVLIAGSGSIALGINHKGETARSGGWGYLFGDEGGGFGIARDGLKLALQSMDIGKPSRLAELYRDFFGGTQPGQLARDFYAGKIERDTFATITPQIAALAKSGDPDASGLFERSGKALGLNVAAVAEKLDWPSDVIHWAPVGGVFKSESLILDPIHRVLGEHSTYQFACTPPKLPPVVGAALLALQKVAGPPSASVIMNLTERREM